MKRGWEPSEIFVLRRNAGVKSAAEIGRLLNRTDLSVQMYACLHGISLQKFGEKHRSAVYSDATIERVRVMRENGASCVAISAEVGMSPASVRKYTNFYRRLGNEYERR